jgi:hypothetical protein
MFDVKGNELAVGDDVVLKGKVAKVTEGSFNVTIETTEPAGKPGMKTTIAVRGESLEKVK